MKVRIQHRTTYRYDTPALLGPHVVRLRPAPHTRTPLLSYALHVTPDDATVGWKQNPWGSREARIGFPAERPVEELTLLVDAAFDVRPVNPFDFFVDDDARELPFAYDPALARELAPFLRGADLDATPRLKDFVASVPLEGLSVDYLVRLNQAVASEVAYVIRNEPGVFTPEETLEKGRGSCRDSAQLLVAVLRARGLAARFVSGYLIQLTDEGNIPDVAKGVSMDVVDLHAWAEVYLPGAGWIGLDGTSGLLCGEGHIPLAYASSPELAAPVSGTSSEPSTGFEFEMTVERLGHEPRPRKPYEEGTWRDILRAGEQVDAHLAGQGIRLTCGGEPTWTSREHPALPEWNTEALGETKSAQGLRLAHELRERFGEGTLFLQRMGKQYPGESLPRWAIDLIWRVDGVPIWRDPKLLEERIPRSAGAAQRAIGADDAHDFLEKLAKLLDVPRELVPAFEDPWHFIEQEARLPEDVDPLELDLDDDEERRRLARVLQRGLGRPVGWVLPVGKELGRWVGAKWSFRREKCFLVPGDSPVGLRLPLDQLGVSPSASLPADVTRVRDEDPLDFDPEGWS
ncbi:MAG TPA: transglutaminase family protein, partial [Polyangiaceae bacterium LLY-WYZ-15_(1-7)]|nr:transglutaminase family protein [Polyangiaceae bacterium LLY-WYZ-15_(1-7)]